MKIAWNKGLKRTEWTRELNCLCLTCGIQFHRKPYKILNGRGKYCSRKCKNPADATRFMRENNPRWNNGVRVDQFGYRHIRQLEHPNASYIGDVAEHRLVMEKYLKRYLSSEEVVHHRNGKKNDNRIENLELFENQSAHIRTHHKGKGGAGFHSVYASTN